jgi:hypothetical protein
LIERVFRERWRRVLAGMVGNVGDFDIVELELVSASILGRDGV